MSSEIPDCSPGRPAQSRPQLGTGFSIKDAQNTNQGDAQHQPAWHLLSASSMAPKSPTGTGTQGLGSSGEKKTPFWQWSKTRSRSQPCPGVQPPQPTEQASGGRSTQPHSCFREMKDHRGCHGGLAAGHPSTARSLGAPMGKPVPAQPGGQNRSIYCICLHWNFPSLQ